MTTKAARPIRLMLIDDHALFREGLSRLLQSQPDFLVVGLSESATEGIAHLVKNHPDVVLLDVDLGAERAQDFLSAARAEGFEGRILVVTAGIGDTEALQLISCGVAGIFHKHNAPETLCEAIRKVASGEPFLEPKYLKALFQCADPAAIDPRPKLTAREVQVLRHILQGLANKEIGDQLGISESSVKAVLRALFQKTGARTRSQLVKVALEEYRDLL